MFCVRDRVLSSLSLDGGVCDGWDIAVLSVVYMGLFSIALREIFGQDIYQLALTLRISVS